MPLLATAEEVILKALNTENSLDLKVAEVVFGTPAIPTEPDDVTKAQGLNSMVRIQALATANAIGATTVYYDRVDFADMFTGVDGIQPMRIPARLDAVFTAHQIVGLINQYYGLSLRANDIVDTDIDRKTWMMDLIATPTSLGWIGQQQIQLLPGDALLPINFEPVTVMPYEYPYFNTKVGQSAVYSYPWRFDNYAAEFQNAGLYITPERLAQILKTVTGDGWMVYRNPVNYNLKEAIVVYNGPNKASFPTNPSIDNVLVVELSLYSLNLGGRLYLHYNDPD
ncbi:putative virion structural protein [Erwinia phage vB_EamM_Parshik]|uniref:Putative virion structural protein n=1 Tax=Erwinia phage vB_EamM_Huxley TaxID=1883373 RepID=A0A1B2IDC0_9CAUD|nr:virion structural protein [Erwinia phage vB_EamM_Huxley]ANZ49232.1 putative virion structural protein [Erwinia phage vB_EamM_Huxley]ANZ50060.1 putative virion structural protein [Erwinia phage vB_EamM_Parshik]